MNVLQQVLFTVANTEGASLGIWGGIKYGFTWFLERLFDLTALVGFPSYAVAIFVFTLVVKLVLQPLMNKQMRSTRNMSRLQPQIQELQKRYANNPQKQQEETMRLYKKMGVSPLAGCLPLLIQMPILIALFQALREFVPLNPEYYSFFWITNLSEPDPTGIVLPIIAGAATFFQQFLSTTNRQDKTQKMMLYIMPIMFGFFVRSFPSGLALYWIYYSIIGGLIQFTMNKKWAKEDAVRDAEEQALLEEERLAKKAKKAERKGIELEELLEEEENKDVTTVAGVDYILPPGYTLREKRVKAHPYSSEEEVITVVVLPDGRERGLDSLKRKEAPMPALPDLPSLFGRKKKKQEDE